MGKKASNPPTPNGAVKPPPPPAPPSKKLANKGKEPYGYIEIFNTKIKVTPEMTVEENADKIVSKLNNDPKIPATFFKDESGSEISMKLYGHDRVCCTFSIDKGEE